MNDKPLQLGLIRIAPTVSGTYFDVPYYEEDFFQVIVMKIRADGFFSSNMVYIPLDHIAYICKIPNDQVYSSNAQHEARRATRQ